ncbi:MAG: hypothetical protein ACLQIB_28720 [Isosphaeraceae bacterium]
MHARDPRPDRISFYVFNPPGHRGTGSYVQEPVSVDPPEWKGHALRLGPDFIKLEIE